MAHVLQEPHAQHRWHRPELAHGERRDALILLDHQLEQSGVKAPVRVRDQLDGELVHTWIARERAWTRELRQFVVIVARKGGANFLHLLQHDVEVVEQPLAGGADLDPLGGHARQRVVDATEDALRRGQARQQWPLSARPDTARCVDGSLRAREVAAVSRQALRTEQLTQDDIAWRIRRPHVVLTRRSTSPAAGKPHA